MALVAGLSFAACGSDEPDPDPKPNPTDTVKVEAFAATPTTVAPGQTTTLTWTVSGSAGLSVKIEATPGGELTTSTMLTGSIMSAPINANTTFKITVTKGTATPATREVTVNVDANAIAVNMFTATPAMPVRGGQVTLQWTTSNATSVEIFDGATSRFTSTTMVAMGTTTLAVPNATHTFRLVATSGAMMAERSVTVNTTVPVGEVEPNNDPTTAQVLAGGNAMGAVNPADDVDYYRISVPANGNVRAETSDGAGGCNFDSIVTLFAPDGTTQIATNDDGGEGLCSLLDPTTNEDLTNLGAGDYYLAVEAVGTATGAYSLTVVIGTPGCGNGILEGTEQCDDGNTTDGDGCTAVCQISFAGTVMGPLPQIGSFSGAIVPGTREDNYQVVLPAMGYIIARTGVPTIGTCEPSGANDTILELFDSAGTSVARNDDGGQAPCSFLDPNAIPALLLPAGTYTLRVTSYQSQEIAGYTVEIRTVGLGCGNTIVEDPELCDDGNTANTDGCSSTCTIETFGTINPPGGDVVVTVPADDPANPPFPRFIEVNINEGQSITATTSDGAGGCPFGTLIGLFSADFTQLGVVNGNGGCANINPVEDAFAANLAAGLYHIAVISSEAVGGPLTITVNLLNPACGNNIPETLGLATAEQCDDGNTANGDGCSSTCTIEVAGTVNPPSGNVNVTLEPEGGRSTFIRINTTVAGQSIRIVTSNGNGNVCTVQPDLALNSGDFTTRLGFVLADDTTTDCTGIDPVTNTFASNLAVGSYLLQLAPWVGQGALQVQVTIVNPACGNNITETLAANAETCDDGNTTAGDGCNATCQVEATPIAATIGGAFVTVSGALATGEIDTYSLVIPNGMTATVEALTYTTQGMPALGCGTPDDTILELRSSTFAVLASNDDIDIDTDNLCSSVVGEPGAAALAAGTYYLQVRPFGSGSLANYYLDVRLVP
ncbi:MAG: DVUA0089 family protein [Deltaproteobacteria bacterium]|nr:DVUA0089 family protein [Deltaproteobacteria bacterium]